MNINETAELTAFRTEVRTWIEGSIKRGWAPPED